MKPTSEKRTRAWTETRFSNFQLANSGKVFAKVRIRRRDANCYNTHMHPLYEKAASLTEEVISAAIEVQKHFGVGVLENIYKLSLAQEMRVRGHQAETEVEVPITPSLPVG